MEDISRRTLVAACIAFSIIIGANWMAASRTIEDSAATPQVRNQPEVIDSSIDLSSATRNADADPAATNSKQDDEVDIALGGSWGSSDCTYVPVQIVKASTGELVEAMDCQRSSPKPIHAYESYANKALESLAYSDPIAALVLGRRLAAIEPEKTWDLMIRSSALLGGDSRPIKWLATHSFNQVKINGEMATETMQLRYVLDSLTRKLENSAGQSFDFREDHLRSSLGDAEFARLDRMAESLLNKMKVIAAETTGSGSIGEAG